MGCTGEPLNILIFLTLFAVHITAKRNLNVDIESLSCKSTNTGNIKDFNCILIDKKVSLFVRVNRIVEVLELQHYLYLTPHKMPRLTILNLRINVCDFLRAVHKQKLFAIFMDQLRNHTNFVPTCPFKQNFNYTLTDFMVNLTNANFPESKFRAGFIFFYRGKKEFTVTSEGKVFYK